MPIRSLQIVQEGQHHMPNEAKWKTRKLHQRREGSMISSCLITDRQGQDGISNPPNAPLEQEQHHSKPQILHFENADKFQARSPRGRTPLRLCHLQRRRSRCGTCPAVHHIWRVRFHSHHLSQLKHLTMSLQHEHSVRLHRRNSLCQ